MNIKKTDEPSIKFISIVNFYLIKTLSRNPKFVKIYKFKNQPLND